MGKKAAERKGFGRRALRGGSAYPQQADDCCSYVVQAKRFNLCFVATIFDSTSFLKPLCQLALLFFLPTVASAFPFFAELVQIRHGSVLN